MIGLLKLYPPRWRRRYGEEFRALVGAQRFSFGNTIDLLSGAIDAWINPQFMTMKPASTAGGEETMNTKHMTLRCAGFGPEITRADQWKGIAVTLGTTVVLCAGWMWLHARMHDNPYVDAFALMPILGGWLVSIRHTYLKGRSGLAQAIFITGMLIALAVFFALIGWISSRI